MRLAVVSTLEHYRASDQIVGAWPAAVREIDALASLFDEVVHLGCLHPGQPPAQAIPYSARNVCFQGMPPAGGKGLRGKLHALRSLPSRVAEIEQCWRAADAVLVRCPSNAAAAALLLMALRRGPTRAWIKYTGAWQGRPGEPLAYRLQRWWLRSGLTGAVVTIGGAGGNSCPGAVTLCNPSLSLAEALEAEGATRAKSVAQPWKLLCVGRLVADKGVDIAIRALAHLKSRGAKARLDIAGDGPGRHSLEALSNALDLRDQVRFHGWLGAAPLEELYRQAHALLAPSHTEGWSRAWTDAAARRCIPVVAAVGAANAIEQRGAGLVLDSLEPSLWAEILIELLGDEHVWLGRASQGPLLARGFTYERFLDDARVVLRLGPTPQQPSLHEDAA